MTARDWLERTDHTADDFEDSDFALPAEGVANERAAWRLRDGRAARSELVRKDPILRRAALVSHAEAGIARIREGDERSAELEFEVVLKILRETK
jgi:hypothetical protein